MAAHFDLLALPLWRPAPGDPWQEQLRTLLKTGPPGDAVAGPCMGAVSHAYGPGERLASNHPSPAPRILFLQTLSRIFGNTDAGNLARFMLQDAAQTRCILVEVLGPPRAAPDASLSFGWKGAPGPLLPVRFVEGKRSDPLGPARIKKAMDVVARTTPRNEAGVPFDSGCAPIGCDLDELDLVYGLLTSAAAKVEHAGFAASPACKDGGFVLSYLSVPPPFDWSPSIGTPPPEPPLPRLSCSAEGCSAEAPLRCGGCRGACYCSEKCQRTDWKRRHKKVCASKTPAPTAAAGATATRGADDAARKSVVLSLDPSAYLRELGDAFAPGNMVNLGIDFRSGTTEVVRDRTEPPINVHGSGEFALKVQTGLVPGAQPLMIYDEAKSINFFLPTTVRAGAELDSFVRGSNQGGARGRKAYLKAVREGDNVRVFFEFASIPSW